MIIKFYEVVLSRVRESINEASKRVSSGSMQNFEEYKWLSGKIKGLQEAEYIFLDVFESIQENPTFNKEK